MLAATKIKKRVLSLAARAARAEHHALASIASGNRETMRRFVGLVGELEHAIDEGAEAGALEFGDDIIRLLVDRVTEAVSTASVCSWTLRQLARAELAGGAASKRRRPTVEVGIASEVVH